MIPLDEQSCDYHKYLAKTKDHTSATGLFALDVCYDLLNDIRNAINRMAPPPAAAQPSPGEVEAEVTIKLSGSEAVRLRGVVPSGWPVALQCEDALKVAVAWREIGEEPRVAVIELAGKPE